MHVLPLHLFPQCLPLHFSVQRSSITIPDIQPLLLPSAWSIVYSNFIIESSITFLSESLHLKFYHFISLLNYPHLDFSQEVYTPFLSCKVCHFMSQVNCLPLLASCLSTAHHFLSPLKVYYLRFTHLFFYLDAIVFISLASSTIPCLSQKVYHLISLLKSSPLYVTPRMSM